MTYDVRPAPAGLFLPDAVLDALGAGLIQLEPVFAGHDPAILVSLRYVGANAVAQMLLGLPAQLTGSLGVAGPQAAALFAFCRDTFRAEGAGYFAPGYVAADGTRWQVVAQRHGPQLVVSFTESREPTAPADALAQADHHQPAEQVQARQQREGRQQDWQRLVEQAPVAIAQLRGPQHVLELANAASWALWDRRPAQALHQPLFASLPELAGHGFKERLDSVLATGEPYLAQALPALLDRGGRLETVYLDVMCQPIFGPYDRIEGVALAVADVSAQVVAHQQVLVLNEELFAANEELRANNDELAYAQGQWQQLNAELECRVAAGIAEAQLARADAERRRERLERFFAQAPAAVCVLDGPELVFELVNPSFQALFPGRELLGLPVLVALPEFRGRPVYQQMQRVYATGETHEETCGLIPLAPYAGGPLTDFYFHYVQQARYDTDCRIDGLLVFALDMTAQVRVQRRAEVLQEEVLAAAQRRVQEREAFYQLFAQTPAIISLLRGPEHQFEYVNPAFQSLFPARVLLGRPVADALPEAGPQGFMALLDQVYQTGETFVGTEMPFLITSPTGAPPTDKRVSFTYQAYREQGAVVGVSVFATDVTEQVLARQEREAGLAQLHTIFEQAPVALALLQGPDYVVEVANPAICQMWDRTHAEVLGQPLFAVLPEVLNQGIPELLAEVRRTGQPFVAGEHPMQLQRQKRLETFYFQFVYQPLTDALGHVTAIVVVATDISTRVVVRHQLAQANEDLRTTNTQLIHTNVDLDNFIYTASHDLKAPIANIESLLLLLRKQLPAEAQRVGLVPRVLGMMQESVERFSLTIAQLTDLSRLQQVRAEAGPTADLATVIEAVRLDLAPLLEATEAELTVDISDCETVLFAPQHLRSVVYNLLSNAVKYRQPGRVPRVQLRCWREENQTVLAVQDNGLGLSQQHQSKLFSLFERLHVHVEGTGVGLYMVKRIVENAGGTITVQSEPGVGSTFSIRFPA